MPNLVEFCLWNNIPIRIVTTDDPMLEFQTKHTRSVDADTMVILSHHGHAWLAVDDYVKF